MRLRWMGVLVALVVGGAVSGCGDQNAGGAPGTPEERFARLGKQVYQTYCRTCHQQDGQGIPGAYPPLQQTEWVEGDKGRLIRLVLNGVHGPMEVNGKTYDNVMTPHRFLSDEQIAAVLTHVRREFGNDAEAVSPDEVTAVRRANDHDGLWEAADLKKATGIPPLPAE